MAGEWWEEWETDPAPQSSRPQRDGSRNRSVPQSHRSEGGEWWSAWENSPARHNDGSGEPPPRVGVAEDVGRSSVTGFQQGVSALVGMFGDIQDLPAQIHGVGSYWEARAAGASDEAARAAAQRSIDSDQARDRATVRRGAVHLPTSEQTNRAIQDLAGEQYNPQTTPGRYARTIASFVPSAAAPGGPITRAARVIVPAVASETAGEATQGTPLEPWARAGGAFLGGVGVEFGSGAANAPSRLVRGALGDTTPEQLDAAAELMRRANAVGIRVMPAEAIQHVTGEATAMPGLQRFAENTAFGGPTMRRELSSRAPDSEAAIRSIGESAGPGTSNPSMLGPRGQRAAQSVIDQERRAINEEARPFYDDLRNQRMPAEDYGILAADPVYRRALAQLRDDPELGPLIANLPDDNMHVISEVGKRVRAASDQAWRDGDNHLASVRGETMDRVVSRGEATSPEWSQARRIVRDGSAARVDPLRAGPLGSMAETDELAGQTRALFPSSPPEGGAAEIVRAIDMIAQHDPDLAAQLLRQHLLGGRTGGIEATQLRPYGLSQRAGPQWAASIAGNAEQRTALLAGAGRIAGPEYAARLADLIEGFGAMSRRAGEGSSTYMNQDISRNLNRFLPAPSDLVVNDPIAHARSQALADLLTLGPDDMAQRYRRILRRMPEEGYPLDNSLAALVLSDRGQYQHEPPAR